MKTCTKCKLELAEERFGKNSKSKDGLNYMCKSCMNQASKDYHKNNPAKGRHSPQAKENKKWATIKRKYGITKEQHAALFAKQGNVCAICGNVPRKICVDHDHITDQVRGLLCLDCNLAVGLMKDKPEWVQQMVHYLQNYDKNVAPVTVP